jgi:nucleoside-diphosphate-sugar epimerase
MTTPQHEDEIIKPAVNGTLNVFKGCLNTKVKRVVVTSSEVAAIGALVKKDYTYSEKDWGDSNTDRPYVKSKILAEKAAWDFIEEKKKKKEPCFELAVVNPSLVFGPLLLDTTGTSLDMFIGLFSEKLEKIKENYLPMCDVRDVALAHVRAAFMPEAAGKRFIVVSEKKFISMKQCADIARKYFPQYKLPTEEEPGNGLGKYAQTDNSNLRNILGINPIDFDKTIIDMTNSLIEKGFFLK